jgi:hypothetical protein
MPSNELMEIRVFVLRIAFDLILIKGEFFGLYII